MYDLKSYKKVIKSVSQDKKRTKIAICPKLFQLYLLHT